MAAASLAMLLKEILVLTLQPTEMPQNKNAKSNSLYSLDNT
jgi:hypothetical protein